MNIKTAILLLVLAPGLWADEPKSYFPVSKDGGKDSISSFENEWYLKHLQAMKEPSIYSKRGDKTLDIYRFTLLPTWGNPLCCIVTKNGHQATIQFIRLDGQGGYEPGKVAEKQQRDLTEKEIKDFLTRFDSLDFSEQPTKDPFIGLDGSEWILERLKDGEYHIMVRWTADAYDPKNRGTASFVGVCQWMLAAAPRKIEEAEQAGTGQPAPRPESEPEGGDKPQPEAEGRSR